MCATGSAAGDGRQDLHLAAVLDRRLQAVAEAHVLAVDVDVDEAAQAAVAVRQAVAQLRMLRVERLEHGADGVALDGDCRLAAGGGAQLRGELDGDAHQALAPAITVASNASNRGSISWASNVPRTASRVLSPSPVIPSTTVSCGSMSPRAASLARVAVVTPPAVSVKMPVVSASRRMPARISSSVTLSIPP